MGTIHTVRWPEVFRRKVKWKAGSGKGTSLAMFPRAKVCQNLHRAEPHQRERLGMARRPPQTSREGSEETGPKTCRTLTGCSPPALPLPADWRT